MTGPMLGALLHSFFVDHLVALKGLRPASVKSYRDALRLFLLFVAGDRGVRLTRISIADLTYERVQRFLRHLEDQRGNHPRTRNHRLAALHIFFDYLTGRVPEMMAIAERVAAIPSKRAPPPETRYLDRDEVARLLAGVTSNGRQAERDRALLLFLYNTGARVQEVADLRACDVDLSSVPRVRLHGKGDKWRTCPLWKETANQLRTLLARRGDVAAERPVFVSRQDRPLTRFGIYKLVRRHAAILEANPSGSRAPRVSPHVFRHTAAVHLLESGVEVNVIRAWLGHVSLETTNRYAEITTPMKEAALRVCEPPDESSEAFPRKPAWRDDDSLLAWLASL